jgi:hypothetical protein
LAGGFYECGIEVLGKREDYGAPRTVFFEPLVFGEGVFAEMLGHLFVDVGG